MVEHGPVDRVVAVVAPAGLEIGPPAAKAVQLALGGPDGGGGIGGDAGQDGVALGQEPAPAEGGVDVPAWCATWRPPCLSG